jgi:hypothetical protein
MEGVSEPSTHPVRPPHVTIASAIVIVGSVFVVLQMWDRIAGLHSLDTRTTLATYLAGSRLGDAGMDVAQLATVVRITAMAAAGCATAMLILGWQVTKRSRSARLALTVLAGALVVAGMVSDWFVESAAATFWAGGIGAAVVTLWLGPARMWFSDKPIPEAASARVVQRQAPPPQRYDAPPPPAQQQPPPMHQQWPPTSTYDGQRRAVVGQRPASLLAACVLTWVCTAFAAVILVVSIATLSQNSQPVIDEAYRQNPQLADQGFAQHDLLVLLYVVIGLVLAGALAAAGFAIAAYRGHRWAWYALLIASAASTFFFLVGTLGSPIGLLPALASGATFACLMRSDVRAWLIRR